MSKPIVSSKKNYLSKKITFTSTLNTSDFEVMYRIKLKRICKGYSQQELAFLLGKPKDYITARERLEDKKGYTFLDINKLAFILDYDCPSFVPVKASKIIATYTGSEVRENEKIYHEISIKAGASHKLLFKLEEDDPEINHFPASEERQLNKLKTFLATLCEIGYFSQERAPFEIFGCCSRTIPGHISVRLIEQAVNHCISQKKIRKVERREYITYQSV
jgi:transcriptional regulator with XRE-family HTH domain